MKLFFIIVLLTLLTSGTCWIAHKIGALEVIIDKYRIYMQHLANLAEANSYSAKERNKFAGWYKQWTEAHILLMVCLSLEVLQPAKLLSKTFQNKNVDMVDVVTYISQTKKQLKRIGRKDFESLPTIRRFLNSVKEEEEKQLFQGFNIAKTIVSSKKKCVA